MNNVSIYEQKAIIELSVQNVIDILYKKDCNRNDDLSKLFNMDISFNTTAIRAVWFDNQYVDPRWAFVFDQNKYIFQSAYLKPDNLINDIIEKKNKQAVKLSAEYVYFVGYNHDYGNYYHWCVQSVPSFILYFSLRYIYPNLKLLLPSNLPDFAFQYLKSLNIDLNSEVHWIDVNTSLFFVDHLIYPSFLGGEFAFNTSPLILSFFKNIFYYNLKSSSSIQVFKKNRSRILYCARLDSKNRIIKNEQQLVDLLKEKYEAKIYFSAGKSIGEQANTFYEADVIIAPHGAGLSNLLYCKNETTIIELIPDKYMNPCFATLAVNKGMKYCPCVFSTISYEGHQHDYEWEIDLETIDASLSELIKF